MMKLTRRWQQVLATCCILLLSACANFNNHDSSLNQKLSIFTPNAALNEWSISGKVGIRTQQKAASALLNWQQCGDNYHIRMSGPLGAGSIYLYGNQYQATLEAQKETITAANAQQLLAHTGWPIPVDELQYWLRGLPLADKPFTQTADTETPGFVQSDWSLQFSKTLTANRHDSSYTLPAKAIAEGNNMKVTLLLRSWDLTPNCEYRQ